MTRTDDTHDPAEQPPTDDRYAGLDTSDAFVVFDTETESAWIRSDTAVDRTELR